jgi:hypothetical protein
MDNSGTHCSTDDKFKVELNDKYSLSKIDITEDLNSRGKMETFHNKIKGNIFKRIILKLKRIIK